MAYEPLLRGSVATRHDVHAAMVDCVGPWETFNLEDSKPDPLDTATNPRRARLQNDLTEMIIAAIENERKATEPIPTPVPGPAVTVEPPQAHPKPEIERRGGFSMSMGDLGRLPVGTPSKPGPIHSHPMYSNGHPMGPPNGMTEMSPMGMPGPMHGGMGNGMPMHMPPRHTGPYGGPIHNGNMHGMHRDMAHGMHGGHMPGGAPMHGGMMMHGGMSHERERWRQDEFAKMEGDRADGASSSSLSPSGERKKLSRKEFRETIGVQLYADLMSGEYSYDEVIAKYKKLYPEYESKFTRNFCSKTRCGRIMTASTSEPKRNVKAGDPKIQRISKKSPRKPWTRMTRELFDQILVWEKDQANAKRSDIEEVWNVNRSTYHRWKKKLGIQ